MRVEQFRAGIAKLAAALDELKAKEFAADLVLLDEFLRPFEGQTMAACLSNLQRRLEDRPPPARKTAKAVEPSALQAFGGQIAAARGDEDRIRAVLSTIDAEKSLKLAEIQSIASSAGISLASKTRPKAIQELLSALLYEVLQRNRLEMLDRRS